MNRRQFTTLTAAGFLWLPTSQAGARQVTPSASPTMPGRPSAVDLGSGISLIDYRAFPSSPNHKVIGEIRNEREQMVDAPVVSMRYPVPHSGDPTFAYAPPIVPVIEPGGSIPIFGALPDTDAPEEALASATFGLCSPVEHGEYSVKQAQLELKLETLEEHILEGRYATRMTLHNVGESLAEDTAVRGIVRDADGRIAGCTAMALMGTVPPGEPRDFWLVVGLDVIVPANPFVLINDDDEYTVDTIAGTRGPVLPPRCTLGAP